MASNLQGLLPNSYDTVVGGMIQDENTDQARGQDAMQYAGRADIANRELDQRENEAQMAVAENERQRAFAESQSRNAFGNAVELEKQSAGYRMAEQQARAADTSAESKLHRDFLQKQYAKQNQFSLETAILQEKAEQARLSGQYEVANAIDARARENQRLSARGAFNIAVMNNAIGKSETEFRQGIEQMGQKVGEISRTHAKSLQQLELSIPQLFGRIEADRKAQGGQAAKAVRMQHEAMRQMDSSFGLFTPNLSDIEQNDGIQYLKFNLADNLGASLKGLDRSRTVDDFAVMGEMDAAEMTKYVSDHIGTSMLNLFDEMGIKSIDKPAATQAINAMMQGRPEAEIIPLLQKARLDPTLAKGAFDVLARTHESETIGGSLKMARDKLQEAKARTPGQSSLAIRAAEANLRAIQTYGTQFRKAAKSVTNVVDFDATKSMLEAFTEWQRTGQVGGLLNRQQASRAGVDSDLLDRIMRSQMAGIQAKEGIARAGFDTANLAVEANDIQRARELGKFTPDLLAGRSSIEGMEGLLAQQRKDYESYGE